MSIATQSAHKELLEIAERIKQMNIEATNGNAGWSVTVNAIEKLEEAEGAMRYAAKKVIEA